VRPRLWTAPSRLGLLFSGGDDFLAGNIRVKKDLDALGALGDLAWYNVRVSLEAAAYRRPTLVQGHLGAVRNSEGVLIECGATLLWADGLISSFDCSFRNSLRQWLEVVGNNSTLAFDDFVLHNDSDGPRCGYQLTRGSGISNYACDFGCEVSERVTADLPLPQESLMWAAFGRMVRAIRDEGAPPDASWAEQSLLTQEILCAVARSLDEDCKPVAL